MKKIELELLSLPQETISNRQTSYGNLFKLVDVLLKSHDEHAVIVNDKRPDQLSASTIEQRKLQEAIDAVICAIKIGEEYIDFIKLLLYDQDCYSVQRKSIEQEEKNIMLGEVVLLKEE